MRCDLLTLFPDMVGPVLGHSMLKRAQDKGLIEVRVWNIRQFSDDLHRAADDTPYGGGAGMVLKAEPIFRAVDTLRHEYQEPSPGGRLRLLLVSPQGRPFTERYAEELRDEGRRLVFLCGHYEGIDERVMHGLRPDEVSIGDYVLTGGELAALVIIDAVARLIPGVLGDPESAVHDSFSDLILDYPHYTRPVTVRGMDVPEILLSGNHEAIRVWRRKEALRNTYSKRPDLIRDRQLCAEDRRLLEEIFREGDRKTSAAELGGGV
jgi:tRNA (guanine37-N1)-methyltransferase